MPSPFPGMNPFLEQESLWHSFHQRFIARAADFLVPQVRPYFFVEVELNVYLHELPGAERRLLGSPDVYVGKSADQPRPAGTATKTTMAVTEGSVPASVPLAAVDELRDSFIEVRDAASRDVIAVIELLSPSNKRISDDRGQYVAKRLRTLRSRAHFIEIDLLRGWPRMSVDGLPPCDYYAMVSRVEARPDVRVWSTTLRQRLPSIPIPLTPGKPDAVLDLQAVLDQVYDAAGYEDRIYTDPKISPSLSPDDLNWAMQYVPEQFRSALSA